jgi:hypothetical protein
VAYTIVASTQPVLTIHQLFSNTRYKHEGRHRGGADRGTDIDIEAEERRRRRDNRQLHHSQAERHNATTTQAPHNDTQHAGRKRSKLLGISLVEVKDEDADWMVG